MYPVALYGSLPEIAYLAPRGSFMARPAADAERPPRQSARRASDHPPAATRDEAEAPRTMS